MENCAKCGFSPRTPRESKNHEGYHLLLSQAFSQADELARACGKETLPLASVVGLLPTKPEYRA